MREASAIEAALALASGRSDGDRDGMDEVETAGAEVAVAEEDVAVAEDVADAAEVAVVLPDAKGAAAVGAGFAVA